MSKGNKALATVTLGAAVAALVVTGITGCASTSESPRMDNASASQAGSTPATPWIISTAATSSEIPSSMASAPATRPELRTATSGALLTGLKTLAASVVPAGATLSSAIEYPDIPAATAVFSSGGASYSITVDKLTNPVALASIAPDSTSADLATLATGSQEVQVENSTTGTSQSILARPSGILVTVTLTSLDAAATKQENVQADSAASSAGSAPGDITHALDTASVDKLFG